MLQRIQRLTRWLLATVQGGEGRPLVAKVMLSLPAVLLLVAVVVGLLAWSTVGFLLRSITATSPVSTARLSRIQGRSGLPRRSYGTLASADRRDASRRRVR